MTGGFILQSFQQGPAAPRGAIPARWRTLRALPEDKAALQEDVDQGRLDPAALMAQIAGPLPIPPGSHPAGCYRHLEALTFTAGEELSPVYADLLARSKRGMVDIGDLTDRAALDARSTRERLRAFFTARGFREYSRFGRRMGFMSVATGLRVEVTDMSAVLQSHCDRFAEKMRLPTGPTFRIGYASELGINTVWTDERPAPTTGPRRVIKPFGG